MGRTVELSTIQHPYYRFFPVYRDVYSLLVLNFDRSVDSPLSPSPSSPPPQPCRYHRPRSHSALRHLRVTTFPLGTIFHCLYFSPSPPLVRSHEMVRDHYFFRDNSNSYPFAISSSHSLSFYTLPYLLLGQSVCFKVCSSLAMANFD